MMITGFLVFVIMAHVDKGRRDIQGSVPFMVGITIFANVLVGVSGTGLLQLLFLLLKIHHSI